MIKESQKTKLFVSFEEIGCYLSDQRLDNLNFTEYPVKELLGISALSINNADTYIILYENSKKESILANGKVKKHYENGKYKLTDNLVIYIKGVQLAYNVDTKIVYEKEQTLKVEDPKKPSSKGLQEIYDKINVTEYRARTTPIKKDSVLSPNHEGSVEKDYALYMADENMSISRQIILNTSFGSEENKSDMLTEHFYTFLKQRELVNEQYADWYRKMFEKQRRPWKDVDMK